MSQRDAEIVEKTDCFIRQLRIDGSNLLCEPDSVPDKLPEWFDLDLFRKGQEFYNKHRNAMGFAKLSGLVAVLAIPTILDVLIFTKQSGCTLTAYRRYMATRLHVDVWYLSDIADRNSDFWKSIDEVRRMHSSASKRCRKSRIGKVTQKDMALTQFGFLGFQLACTRKVGLHKVTESELRGFIHMWRCIGYILGIEDRFNICSGTVQETTYLCSVLLRDIFGPEIRKDSSDFNQMVTSMLDGQWTVSLMLNRKIFMYSIWDLCNLKPVPTTLQLNWYEHLLYLYLRFTFEFLFQFDVIRIVNNWMDYANFFLIQKIPIMAILRFGYRPAFVTIMKKSA